MVCVSVLLGSSPWLAGSAVASTLCLEHGWGDTKAAWLSSSVQLGFLAGTVIFAALNLADRFSARWVFAVSATAAALANVGFALSGDVFAWGVVLRFATGVALAGVYPVGMKLVASWSRTGLGWTLGLMVGALVAGTSLPFGLRVLGEAWPWRQVVFGASICAFCGSLLVAVLVRDGPFLPSRAPFDFGQMLRVFRVQNFRRNAVGYFGHMWELYAFWSLLPLFLHGTWPSRWHSSIAVTAFAVVAAGAVGCVIGGLVSQRLGEIRVARVSLAVSATACLASPLLANVPFAVAAIYLGIWGVFVVSDSPQFSALAVRYCPPEYTGTALTVQNGVGFAISIVSIQGLPWLASHIGWQWSLLALAPGPIVGWAAMARLRE